MTPTEARKTLHEDAYFQKEVELLSAFEWEDRVSEVKHLRDAAEIAGVRVIQAISAIIWEWDRFLEKRR